MGGILENKDEKKQEKKARALAEEEKKKSYEQENRGMISTIRTSSIGVATSPQRKKLLGE